MARIALEDSPYAASSRTWPPRLSVGRNRPNGSSASPNRPQPMSGRVRSQPRRTSNDRDPTQHRAELDQAADTAKVEQQRIQQQRQDAAARAERLRAKLAVRPPAEFEESGAPVSESEADDVQSVADVDAALHDLEQAIRNVLNRSASWSELLRPVTGLSVQHEPPSYTTA